MQKSLETWSVGQMGGNLKLCQSLGKGGLMTKDQTWWHFEHRSPIKTHNCTWSIGCTWSLRARSLLYIGPNLFRPPRIRSCRTAGEREVSIGRFSKSTSAFHFHFHWEVFKVQNQHQRFTTEAIANLISGALGQVFFIKFKSELINILFQKCASCIFRFSNKLTPFPKFNFSASLDLSQNS